MIAALQEDVQGVAVSSYQGGHLEYFEYLVELCEKGLERRYERVTPELRERLQFELKTIREMGFADYFLIVWNFIHFA